MLGKADCHVSIQEGFVGKFFLPKSSYFNILNFSSLINFVIKVQPTKDGRVSLIMQDSDWFDGRF